MTTEENNSHPKNFSMEDVVLEPMHNGQYNPVEQLLSISTKFEDFAPKARFSKKQSGHLMRLLMTDDFLTFGEVQPLKMTFMMAGFSIGQDGLGRKEGINVVVGKKPQNAFERQRNMANQERTLNG